MSIRTRANVAAEILLIAASLVVGLLLVRRAFREAPPPPPVTSSIDTAVTRQEIVLVYIGDVDCSFCTSDQFTLALEQLVTGLRQEVQARGNLFRAVGVMITRDFSRGFRYLKQHGDWDEISLGGGWSNILVEHNVWNAASDPTVPQVVVYSREIQSGSNLLMFTHRNRRITVTGALAVQAITQHEDWARLLPASMER